MYVVRTYKTIEGTQNVYDIFSTKNMDEALETAENWNKRFKDMEIDILLGGNKLKEMV